MGHMLKVTYSGVNSSEEAPESRREPVGGARGGADDPDRDGTGGGDAESRGGAGALATWMAATGNEDALDPIVEAIHRLIDNIAPDAHEKRLMHEDTLALVLMALGDAQLGGPMAEALDLPRDTSRVLATELITGRIAKFWAEHGGKPAA